MSYILEALKKAQAERQIGSTPTIHAPTLAGMPADQGARSKRIPVIVAMALMAAAIAGLATMLVRQQPAASQAPAAPQAGAAPVVAAAGGTALAPNASAQPGAVAPSAATPGAGDSHVSGTASQQPVGGAPTIAPGTAVPPAVMPLASGSRAENAAAPQPPAVPSTATQPAALPLAAAPPAHAAVAPPAAPRAASSAAPPFAAAPSGTVPAAAASRAANAAAPQGVAAPRAPGAEAATQPPPARAAEAPRLAATRQAGSVTRAADAPPTVAPVEEHIQSLQELPEPIQRAIPQVTLGGYMYSKNPADRLLLIDKVLRREGEEVAPGLVLDKLLPRQAIFSFRGYRYRVPL